MRRRRRRSGSWPGRKDRGLAKGIAEGLPKSQAKGLEGKGGDYGEEKGGFRQAKRPRRALELLEREQASLDHTGVIFGPFHPRWLVSTPVSPRTATLDEADSVYLFHKVANAGSQVQQHTSALTIQSEQAANDRSDSDLQSSDVTADKKAKKPKP